MPGKVTLVGAGPGDPGLLTVKGRRALEAADVVVYDRLVSPAVLSMIPEGARRIDVGKQPNRHTVPQSRINQILLEEAEAGHNVVRLKGGDPFVFGRGGEELELLERSGVAFEEIPGVTSAVAAAAWAGIPVTHRDLSSSLHIITGHAREGGQLSIDFEALVRMGGTLVFLMGVAAMPAIVRGLLEAGMDGGTPAAMVENGTLPTQRRCDATLATLPQRAGEMGIHSPALIVIGGVCALAEKFCWFDRLPLKGRKILVTRPKARSGALSGRLRELGADVIEYPCIETAPILPCPDMERALERIGDYEWLAFTSPAGVEAFWNCLEKVGRDARALGGVRLAAVGPGTARELALHGLRPDYVPPSYDGGHLGRALAELARGRVLLLRAEGANRELAEALSARGIAFDDIACYRTSYDNPRSAALRGALEAGEIEYAAFTSASTVKGFAASVGEGADFSRITGLCIGRRTAEEAKKYGLSVRTAREATMDALVELAVAVCEENSYEGD